MTDPKPQLPKSNFSSLRSQLDAPERERLKALQHGKLLAPVKIQDEAEKIRSLYEEEDVDEQETPVKTKNENKPWINEERKSVAFTVTGALFVTKT